MQTVIKNGVVWHGVPNRVWTAITGTGVNVTIRRLGHNPKNGSRWRLFINNNIWMPHQFHKTIDSARMEGLQAALKLTAAVRR
jgi:hypothetical protein